MKKTSERALAIDILTKILRDKGYNNIVLRQTLEQNAYLTPSQRNFITMVVNGTIRNLIFIDYVIDSFSTVKTEKMDAFILNDLRLAVFQLKYLEGAPDYAVCNEATELVKANGFARQSGFVNAILRSFLRAGKHVELPDESLKPFKHLSVKYSYQEWMVESFVKSYGFDRTKKILEINNTSPRVSIYANTHKTTKSELKSILESENINVSESVIDDNMLIISGTSNMAGLESFKAGLFFVIDESSVFAVKAMQPQKDKRILDLCAAPGGKSFVLALLAGESGKIKACDIHKHKLALIKQTSGRLGLKNIDVSLNDATLPNEAFLSSFDYVLVDAPCAGLGLVRKKPDIKLSKSKKDVKILSELQRKILANAAAYVKTGGELLYCTCSLTDEENINNAEWFSKKFDFSNVDLTEYAMKAGLSAESAEGGCVTILPHYFGTDGFFISKFVKN